MRLVLMIGALILCDGCFYYTRHEIRTPPFYIREESGFGGSTIEWDHWNWMEGIEFQVD